MMVMIIVGLLISLNSYASEWSPATCYIKQKDDPRAIILEEDPYGLSTSAPLKSSKNPLYIKEPLPEHNALRKVNSEPNKHVSFAWDTDEQTRDSLVFLETRKKAGLLKKIRHRLSRSDQKLQKLKNASFCN